MEQSGLLSLDVAKVQYAQCLYTMHVTCRASKRLERAVRERCLLLLLITWRFRHDDTRDEGTRVVLLLTCFLSFSHRVHIHAVAENYEDRGPFAV